MLSPADFLHLPYTHDLTPAGIAYTCRWLAYSPDRTGKPTIQHLRSLVADAAVELAFRRYLAGQEVPYQNLGAAPFSDPNRYDISLGGRRIKFHTSLITQKPTIRQVRKDPASLLHTSALTPGDSSASEPLAGQDLYLFAFVTALVTANRVDLQRALGAGQPACCLHALPASWAQPDQWVSLGTLALKSECSETLEVELGGRSSGGGFIAKTLNLRPHQRLEIQADFHTLAYLGTSHLPDGRLGVYSPRLQQTSLIKPFDWINLWVYGMQVILVGYLTRGEYRRRAAHLPAGSRPRLLPHTSSPSLSLPVSDLRPIAELLHSAKEWAAARRLSKV